MPETATTPPDTTSVHERLARVLDGPQLARAVPRLRPETLHQIVRYRGLESCDALIAAATPEQLTSVLDLDLWRNPRPGLVEQFDAVRFGEWVEFLIDAGSTFAARTVAAIDPGLVTAGLSRYVRVFDPATFEPSFQSDDEGRRGAVTVAEELSCELGGYLVQARQADAWDAIVALLATLAEEQADYFHRVMGGCRRLSDSGREVDGLDELPADPAQLLLDLAIEREQRRSHQGYMTPDDARAFLQVARQPHRVRQTAGTANSIVSAYFRAAEEAHAEVELDEEPGANDVEEQDRSADRRSGGGDEPDPADAIVELLAAAGLVQERPRALIEGRGDAATSRKLRLTALMEHVHDADIATYEVRGRELAFLANTLVAGCSLLTRSFTALEASDAVVAVCNIGLEHWPARWPDQAASAADVGETVIPEGFLLEHGLVTAFEVGWAVLHEQVTLFVTDRLIALLATLPSTDSDTLLGLHALRRELRKQRESGTPWLAQDALDVIATLDMPVWASLLGLLSECPVLPEVLRATLEGRTGAVSATAFEFIATREQIDIVRAFMDRVLELLDA